VDDLAAFYAARLDEEGAVARAAGGSGPEGQWARHEDEVGTGYGHLYDVGGDVIVYDEGAPGDVEFDHIARHDPARVLREVEAKRALLALHRPNQVVGIGRACTYCGYLWPCPEARITVSVWSDHPDYRPEWKP
jgi:hypothetical protein